MDRVVLDTNVLVSALIGKGNPKRILELVFSDRVALCLSVAVVDEYSEVLSRPKFSRYPAFSEAARATLENLKSLALFVEPAQKVSACPDPDDDKFVELAQHSGAAYLITGNKKHFPVESYRGTRIVSPTEFLRARRQ